MLEKELVALQYLFKQNRHENEMGAQGIADLKLLHNMDTGAKTHQ
jgi:hypothetical protein